MYSLKEHIQTARAKDEDWMVTNLLDIMTEVCPYSHDIACNEWTLAKLDQMINDQRAVRDEFKDIDELTFTREFSKMTIIIQVRELVAHEIFQTDSEEVI